MSRRVDLPVGWTWSTTGVLRRRDPVAGPRVSCEWCGRIVVGYVPSPSGDGHPCCSLECARELALAFGAEEAL